MKQTKLINPILQGFYPDPSICSVNNKFYLVNSTFSYFPGIPIFESQDLVHWHQIGNAINRNSQIKLDGNEDNEGIYAPTIRYYNGTFYIIADHETKKNKSGMFIITANKPEGPWSDPVYIKEADGIDPSLFIDNGKFYFVATHSNSSGSKYFGDNEIYLAELDPKSFQFISKKYPLWRGALRNVAWPEGPHIYKHNIYYYLVIAEAGTEFHHAITVARSRNIKGPYEGCPNNPIMTHRFLGVDYPIKNVGHADFVETSLGEWYFVCLASRQIGGYVITGRETFLGKIKWENDWPVLNPGYGILKRKDIINLEPRYYPTKPNEVRSIKEDPKFVYIKNPNLRHYWYRNKKLQLIGSDNSITGKNSPTFIGIRESSTNNYFTVTFNNLIEHNGEFGIVYYQNNQHFIAFTIIENKNGRKLKVESKKKNASKVLWINDIKDNIKALKVKQSGLYLKFAYKVEDNFRWIDCIASATNLSTEVAGGFLGTVCGVYLYGKNNSVDIIKIETSNNYEEKIDDD
ncbi:glycoside hydrolase family 43 protein [Limosilactobacillus walteri]|uniref:Glycoside hydrolase family 43 protein n=1 Tax=Limosilactobacillus walteri TaxID=2268022 RepID=A0ABR8P9G2_9LACO|nr:glycoside hydrolase family 43 protein [Limosilactobacillus walteri]MBD5807331.1 glycoside hydrolase family 43 protein [Limosilactobacillus walteri]